MGPSKYGSQPLHVVVDLSTLCALLVGGVTERSGGELRMVETYCCCYHGDGMGKGGKHVAGVVNVMLCCQNVQGSIVGGWLRHTVLPPPRFICDSARLNGSAYEMRASEGGSA